MKSKVEGLEGRAVTNRALIDEHVKSEWPHGVCRAHAESLKAIQRSLDILDQRMERTHDLLLEWMKENGTK